MKISSAEMSSTPITSTSRTSSSSIVMTGSAVIIPPHGRMRTISMITFQKAIKATRPSSKYTIIKPKGIKAGHRSIPSVSSIESSTALRTKRASAATNPSFRPRIIR